MLGKSYDNQVCSIARALEVVGERWSLLIVRDALFAGVTRFGDFQHNLGIATNVLQARLDGFVDAGLMERQAVDGQATRAQYVLTEQGRDLAPTLIALTEWGDRYYAPEAGRPIEFLRRDTGAEVHLALTSGRGSRVDPAVVTVRPGPGMPAEYLASRRPARD